HFFERDSARDPVRNSTMRVEQIIVGAQRRDRRDLQSFLADAGMHESADLACFDQFGDALLEPAAEHDLLIDVELELFIHRDFTSISTLSRQPSESTAFLQTFRAR